MPTRVDDDCGMNDDARSTPLRDSYESDGQVRDTKFYSRGVVVMAVGFLGTFGGFQAAQGLQTSLDATLGFINLAALYTTFTVLCLIAPPMLSTLEAKIGLRMLMFLSAVTYACMAVSNVYTVNWALPISMNVLVGIGAPLLWTGQNDYVGRCAYHATEAEKRLAVHDPTVEDESDADKLAKNTAKFNTLFFSIYQVAGFGGNVIASGLMLAFADKKWMKDVLFVVLGFLCLAGAVTFLSLPKVGPGGGQEETPTLRATAVLAVSDYRMCLMIPLLFTNGMTLAFLFGDYATDLTCPVAGTGLVGFVVATFFIVNSQSTLLWGRLITKNVISRRTAYIVATMFTLTYLGIKFFWKRPDNYSHDGSDWNKVADPAWFDYIGIFGLPALFAMGDAFWESGATATLQNFYLGTPHCVPAMANYKLWQSFGLAAQFVIGAVLKDSPQVRTGILIVMVVVSLICLLALDCLLKRWTETGVGLQ